MTNHTAQIIQLFAPRPKPGKKFNLRVTVSASRPPLGQPKRMVRTTDNTFASVDAPKSGEVKSVSDTAENFRLRQERYFAWREATAVMNYWLAVMRMKSAISCVQNYGTPEGDTHEFVTDETHGMLVTKWRAAWACLMLTPAPNGRELNWKRDQIKGKKWKYNGLSAARIEQAIADDVEWLEAHPTRKGGRKPSKPEQEQ
jgi:hypothetical protein